MTTRPIFLFLLLIGCCYGNENDVISHLILLDKVPDTIGEKATPEIEIRTNFSGQIEFRESEKFKVLLNISAPSIQEAYAVSSELVDYKGKILLQVHHKHSSTSAVTLEWIFLVIGSMSGFVFFLTILYASWWYTQGKHRSLYDHYLPNATIYRSQNSLLGAVGENIGDADDNDVTDADGERRKLEKLRVSIKPETIIEESEGSDDDKTMAKIRYTGPQNHLQRQRSLRAANNVISNENLHGSGLLDYPDQSADELENDLSPEQKVADADGSYTPLDELDDMWHDNNVQNSQSTAKLADPRGNLDYNIHASKSDGDLLVDHKKFSEKEKVIIPPLKLEIPKKTKPSSVAIAVPKRAEPNIYQRGLNLKQPINDLSSTYSRPDRIRAQVHTPEQPYVNHSYGNYIELKTPDQLSKSRISRESNDAYELFTYPADIPMSTFKAANTSPVKESSIYQVPKKPKPVFQSGSPTNFDFNRLNPRVPLNNPTEPYSPGNFSMLDEGSSSDFSDDEKDDNDDDGDFMRLEDSDLDLPSPVDHHGDEDVQSNTSLPLPSPPPMSNQFMPYDTHGRISQLSPRQSLVTQMDDKEYGTVIALTGSPSPGGPYSKHVVDRFVFPPVPNMYSTPQQGAWGHTRRELNYQIQDSGDYVGLPMNLSPTPVQMAPPSGRKAPPPGRMAHPQLPPLQTFRGHGRGLEHKHSFGKRDRQNSEGDREQRGAGADREQKGAGSDREGRPSGSDRERHQSGSDRERKQSFGKKGGKLPKHSQLTLMTTVCVMSIISGVYCISSTDKTRVNIVVFVPPSFPYKNSTIYTAPGKNVKVLDAKGMNWFVSPNPILHNRNSTQCTGIKCEHICDANTGQCICRHGYNMENGRCVDINECQTGMIQCPHPQAGCANVDGTYECLCMSSSNLYKYEDLCLDCRDPCPDGKYEIQPCRGTSKKICKECTKSCGDNFYMQKPCSDNNDAVCLMCQPRCNSEEEFEFSQCSATQNRQCKEKHLLPSPSMSPNVILDDLAATIDKEKPISYQPMDGVYMGFILKRGHNGFGSHFWIQIQVQQSQSIVMFKPVNHSDAMSQSDFTGNKDILKSYCPYPLPTMYNLQYTKHNDVYYKNVVQDDTTRLEPCESKPDSFPQVSSPVEGTTLCSEPGVLSDVFTDIHPEDYETTETVWVEKDKLCSEQHERCENCSRSCILQMNAGLIPYCGLAAANTVDDVSGKSPRIPTCLSCCIRDNCTGVCKNYHDDRCSLVKCQRGSLVQFKLEPVYPQGGVFFCHVEPVLGERLLRIEYEVRLKNSDPMLLSGNLTLYTDEKWQKTGKISGRDSIIHAEIDSQLQEIPNIIQGLLGSRNVKVGTYLVQGEHGIMGTKSGNTNISIQPDTPFGISPKKFGKQKCSDSSTDWEHIVTRRSEDIFNISNDLIAIHQGDSTYLVSHKEKAILRIGLNENVSLLKAVLKPTEVKYETLAAKMMMNGTHWIVLMQGEISTCPGVFSLNFSDPFYIDTPIYEFDVGVECPPKFQINFTIPTGDTRDLSKDMQIQVRDTKGVFILRIHTVGKPDVFAAKTGVNQDSTSVSSKFPAPVDQSNTTPTHFSILFIAVVSGVIILLMLLLVFGVAWKQGIPEGKIARFRLRHLVLYVVYITFQFVYSLFVSMTCFGLIIVAVNRDTTTFLQQYNQQRSVTTALSQLEMDSMEQHLWTEMKRQSQEAVDRKQQCHDTITLVIEDVEKLQKSIETAAINKIQKQDIQKLIVDYTEATFDKFSQDILKFRESYRNYQNYTLHKLNTELETAYNSVQKSKWLQGARYLYQIVGLNKNLMNPNSQMIPFMEWVNLEMNREKLVQGFLDLPDLPDLRRSQFQTLQPQPRATTFPQNTPISSQTINKWFVQPNLPTYRSNRTTARREERTRKVSTLDPGSYMIFLVGAVVIDFFWLLHRMIKACGIGQLLLYGYPIYVNVREGEKKINKKSLLNKIRNILNKILSTLFIPKLIGTLFVCLMVYFVSLCAHNFINRETFSFLGYHNNMEDIMHINEVVINRRLDSQAERINKLEYKMYEDAMNINIQNHQYVLNLVETQWRAIEQSQTNTYCDYLRRINVTASCGGDSGEGTLLEVRSDRCTFAPVIPVLYERNATSSSKIAGMQLDGFLQNIRKLISDTCYIIVIYLSSIVIKELLSTVLWIYIKRSGFVSLRIIYETNEAPGSADSSTTNK